MNRNMFIRWVIRGVLFFYALININAWIQVLFPIFCKDSFAEKAVYEVYNVVGGSLLLLVIILIIAHISQIFKIEKKVFWALLILFLLNLLLMFLEVKRHGDS